MFNDFRTLTTNEKALKINLDPKIYGALGEIGAGQEVAAHLFQAGGASGTIAMTSSAYDMQISDAMYGSADRYVSQERCQTMLEVEYSSLIEKLGDRKDNTCFFSFSNTIEALNYHKTNQGHGWLGVKFQLKPNTPPNECIIHVLLHDNTNFRQQQAIGVLGINLLFACFYNYRDPNQFLQSLVENLFKGRIEIDMFKLTGPDFEHIDNRLMALKLVRSGLTEATLFNTQGEVLQPATALYKKNVMVLRGRFRPATLVNLDMLEKGLEMFEKEPDVNPGKLEVITELTLKDLSDDNKIDESDFLDRVDVLLSLGHSVMISNYVKYYKLAAFLSDITKGKKIGLVLGMYNLDFLFDEKYYTNLKGGILEAFGLGFGRNVKLYIYPCRVDESNQIKTIKDFEIPNKLKGLFDYLIANDKLADIENPKTEYLNIFSDNVLTMIKYGAKGWEKMVPKKIATTIKNKKLFGFKTPEKDYTKN